MYARRLSEILGTRWEQIELGDYHRYFDDWDQLYGVSTHAHGMYHIEFYHQLRTRVSGGNPFLSGIIGDAWAGSVDIPALTSGADVNRLGYTHGMHADSAQSMLPVERSLRSGYWESHKHPLQDPRFRVVEAMRFKLILLSYLEVVPRVFGFQWWSPFVDIEVAMAMLNLPPERRRMRAWQKEFFRRHGLDFDSMNLSAAHQNTLNLQALHRIPVRPLDANMLREVVRPDYVEWINHNVLSRPASWQERTLNRLLRVRRVGGALRRVGLTTDAGKQLKAYCAYLVLRPIENLLRKRNET